MVCRKRERSPPAATEVAMVAVPLAASNNNFNSEFDGASGLTNPAANSKAAKNTDYTKVSLPPIPGGAGGVGCENDVYNEPFTAYEALRVNNSFTPEEDPTYIHTTD